MDCAPHGTGPTSSCVDRHARLKPWRRARTGVRREVRASGTIAVDAIVVDARNERARAFSERYGFKAFASLPRRLFLPIQTFQTLAL